MGWEDPLEKEMTTHSCMLAWEIPWTEEWWWATVHWVTRVGYYLATKPPPPPGKYTAHLGPHRKIKGLGREKERDTETKRERREREIE